ncbi:MarR family transcriptional regulator [Streptomyces sp. NBC_01724]|uniref:MarR family winged helix-turn-helix transcriptional regulator n=1 Tax=Streptomyces TaxID=1883 RepID=UPI0028C4DC77|nr:MULTISPECIES: MarR family transcriptional regulator [unclassified Streptomyces]WTE49549.1 MarR family transcriptional regulator [Streptomyces sp. NBC_01620]WTE57636.1 MarR family transcriptional regulator [Streptomyces sp. NBC_01617]WTI85148.1 MarR family transcriptional regulator [Streptomyces sp. NBC_00724]WNO62682.1 MarR family transcriptional regulator [Streptomyces sp. AM2-3-1]WSC67265.1 MarR family transcriptional regulator [Streptomyces sp. NBC_01760]
MPHDEQPLRPLDRTEEKLVRALGNVMTALPRLVDADMVRDGALPLSEYTPLMFLSEAPHHRMRMSELAAVCNLSLSGMTRVVNRLEKQGLIQRAKCQEDLRGWNAVLTDAGLARLREAWPSHLASIRRHVLDNLAGHDLAALAAALQRVATAP